VPVVVSVHDKRESWLHDSIRNADYVLSVSNAVRELLLAKGIPSNKIYDLANRVDLQVFHPCSDEKLRAEFCDRYPGKYRILHVGRRAPEKNLDTLIRALATLGPDYVCISVGKGDDTEYRRLAEQCGVSRRCYFVGSVPHAQLPHYYSFCDCMCTPSRSEGFGLVFIEALACEAVVVTSNIAPMNEYITNGVSGILVEDFENPAALAEALVQACTDNELRSTIQSNARIAAEPFNKERIDELEGSLYKRFLELGARAGADSQDSSLWSLREKSDAEQLQSKEESGSPLPQKRVCVVNRKPTLPGAPRTKECHQKSGRYLRMQQMLKSCGKIIDLGCGNNPVAGAVVAVDYYVDPRQRSIGYGPPIDENIFRQRNIQFINQKIDVELPFYDKEFDFAYSHHVFEHLDDPATACSEMIRIAKAGAIITPSVFAEMCFGRPYHKWFVIDRDNAIFFFEKRKGEDRPFGDHPQWTQDKGWVSTEKTNPFDMVLNESGWYHEEPCNALERLRERLRQLWFSHSPVIEVVFLWQDSFTYTVIKEATGDNESFDVRDAANIEQVPEEQRIKINAL
jgi:SAM-dependent methyltransferase